MSGTQINTLGNHAQIDQHMMAGASGNHQSNIGGYGGTFQQINDVGSGPNSQYFNTGAETTVKQFNNGLSGSHQYGVLGPGSNVHQFG